MIKFTVYFINSTELIDGATIWKFRIVQNEGGRQVKCEFIHLLYFERY